MMKLALMQTATGKEDKELPLLQRISSLVTSLRNCSPYKCFRVQVTDTSTLTVQRRLRESGLRGRIAAKKPPLKITNKKILFLGQETQAMDIRLVEICPLV
jgi:phenylalanyl-tRNA synthetase beta subunit